MISIMCFDGMDDVHVYPVRAYMHVRQEAMIDDLHQENLLVTPWAQRATSVRALCSR